jgi:hypothetical protein
VNSPVYEEPPPATAADVRAALSAGEDPSRVSALLVGSALHDPEWQSVQDLCLELLDGDDPTIAATAVTCLGHLARLHGEIDKDRVIPALAALAAHPVIGKRVPDALDDIEMFAD